MIDVHHPLTDDSLGSGFEAIAAGTLVTDVLHPSTEVCLGSGFSVIAD